MNGETALPGAGGREKTWVWLVYTVLFLAIAAFVFFPIYANDISILWDIDGIGQYYPVFLYVGQWLRNLFGQIGTGQFSIPVFDLSIGMGESIVGALNYYGFGDPLNLLAIFANQNNGAYVFAGMWFLRLYLAGIAFIKYATYMRINKTLSIAGAVCYLFTGYAISGGTAYIGFLCPLVYLPVILLGCERVWKEKKWLMLALAFTFASCCNLYLLYMACLFTAVYCIVRTLFLYDFKVRKAVCACGKCFLAAVGGFIASLPISYPFIHALLSSKRSNVEISALLFGANWIPSPERLSVLVNGFRVTGGYWSGIPLIMLVFLISAMLPRVRSKRTIQCAIAVWLGFIAATLPITDVIASGFSNVYDRWHFLLIFAFSIVFAATAENYIGLLKQRMRKPAKLTALAICAVNVMICGFLLFSNRGAGYRNDFIPLKDVGMYVDSPAKYSAVIQQDDGLFRISNDSLTDINGRPENVAMLNGYNGLTFWLSVVNQNAQEIANRLGIKEQNYWRSYGLNNSALFESMAGVKYYLHKENETVPTGYAPVEELSFYGSKWTVYENTNALPLIYAIPYDFAVNSLGDAYYSENMNLLEQIVPASEVLEAVNAFEGRIALTEDCQVILAVPYSDDWSVLVDGQEVDVYANDILYTAADCPAGDHTIVFRYSTAPRIFK